MNSAQPAAAFYRNAILAEAPRVLSLMDREPFSPTLGCCDRVHWAWKFVDFPGARFQEALCVMAFLYATPFEDNPYHQNPRLLEWIGHGLRFWSSIQYRDGSFDEAYPYERSLAAVSFTTFYVGEALEFLGDSLPGEVRDTTRESIFKAGQWLTRNDETHGFLSNHLAAAAAALLHAHRVTGEGAFQERSNYFLGRILSRQSEEGWYDEYDGADPGYQTHGSFYLARIWQLNQSEELAKSLDRAMTFLAHMVHVDGSIGGEYASRNTQTYYPAAFEMFACQSPAAAWIAEHMRPTVMTGAAADLRGIDSYNFFPLLNNSVFAAIACAEREEARTPTEPEEPARHQQLVSFPMAGLARIRRDRYDAYIGTSKGGILKVFDRKKRMLVANDCGYLGKLHNGKTIASQYLDHERVVSVENDRITVGGSFVQLSRPVMSPLRFAAFRAFMLTVGRFPSLAQWLKSYLVKVLIYRKSALAIEFERTIAFEDDSITIRDRISGADGSRVAELRWGEIFTTIHMGSSRYFISNELNPTGLSPTEDPNPSEIPSGLTRERKIFLDNPEPRPSEQSP